MRDEDPTLELNFLPRHGTSGSQEACLLNSSGGPLALVQCLSPKNTLVFISVAFLSVSQSGG